MNVATTRPVALRISDKSVARTQAISGLIFALFLVLHLANLVAAWFGQAAFDAWMGAMRWYYQLPLVELAAVLAAAVVHMLAAIVRIRRRRRRARRVDRPSWRVRLHRYSGYFLMAAFFGHVLATRGPGLLGQPANFALVNFSLSYVGAFFFPYYLLLAISGFYHLSHGVVAGLRVLGVRLPAALTASRSRGFWAWAALATIVSLLGVLALGGVLYTPDQSGHEAWKRLANDYVPAALRRW
jgi:succinate dehydrogenase/fumarate reductase cytochrome b subunit